MEAVLEVIENNKKISILNEKIRNISALVEQDNAIIIEITNRFKEREAK